MLMHDKIVIARIIDLDLVQKAFDEGACKTSLTAIHHRKKAAWARRQTASSHLPDEFGSGAFNTASRHIFNERLTTCIDEAATRIRDPKIRRRESCLRGQKRREP